MALEEPAIEVVTVSVAVRVWLPVVCNVAEKIPMPSVSVAFAGSAAFARVRDDSPIEIGIRWEERAGKR